MARPSIARRTPVALPGTTAAAWRWVLYVVPIAGVLILASSRPSAIVPARSSAPLAKNVLNDVALARQLASQAVGLPVDLLTMCAVDPAATTRIVASLRARGVRELFWDSRIGYLRGRFDRTTLQYLMDDAVQSCQVDSVAEFRRLQRELDVEPPKTALGRGAAENRAQAIGTRIGPSVREQLGLSSPADDRTDGRGVTIAIVEATTIQETHPALDAALTLDGRPTRKVTRLDESQNVVHLPQFTSAHALMAASVAAGRDRFATFEGTAPAASLVLVAAGLRTVTRFEGILAAASDERVDIVSCSFMIDPGPGESRSTTAILIDRIITAYDKPVFFAATNTAAGFQSRRGIGRYAIVVGSHGTREATARLIGTSTSAEAFVMGYTAWGLPEDDGSWPDVVAPSMAPAAAPCLSTRDESTRRVRMDRTCVTVSSGTSSATPVAAGTAAIVLSAARQRGIDPGALDLRRLLLTTAASVRGAPTIFQGHGLVDPAAAIARLEGIAVRGDRAETRRRLAGLPLRTLVARLPAEVRADGTIQRALLRPFERVDYVIAPGSADATHLRYCIDVRSGAVRSTFSLDSGYLVEPSGPGLAAWDLLEAGRTVCRTRALETAGRVLITLTAGGTELQPVAGLTSTSAQIDMLAARVRLLDEAPRRRLSMTGMTSRSAVVRVRTVVGTLQRPELTVWRARRSTHIVRSVSGQRMAVAGVTSSKSGNPVGIVFTLRARKAGPRLFVFACSARDCRLASDPVRTFPDGLVRVRVTAGTVIVPVVVSDDTTLPVELEQFVLEGPLLRLQGPTLPRGTSWDADLSRLRAASSGIGEVVVVDLIDRTFSSSPARSMPSSDETLATLVFDGEPAKSL